MKLFMQHTLQDHLVIAWLEQSGQEALCSHYCSVHIGASDVNLCSGVVGEY